MELVLNRILKGHRLAAAWRAIFSDKVAQVTLNSDGEFSVIRANMSEEDFSNTMKVVDAQYKSRNKFLRKLSDKFHTQIK